MSQVFKFRISPDEEERIVALLRDTDMTLIQIAERFRRSRSIIRKINAQHNIRQYDGKRVSWTITENQKDGGVECVSHSSSDRFYSASY